MKRMITSAKERAAEILKKFDPESVEYVQEFKDEIDNLTVLWSDGYDFIEVDPSEEIEAIRHQYIMFGVGEDCIDSVEEFETIYEALCIVEEGHTNSENAGKSEP